MRVVAGLLDAPTLTKLAYGAEAGVFGALAVPAVVCGPGDMAQDHQPDEYLDASELARCDAMLARLVQQLARQADSPHPRPASHETGSAQILRVNRRAWSTPRRNMDAAAPICCASKIPCWQIILL